MQALETYLRELRELRDSGSAVKETSYYGPLAALLNAGWRRVPGVGGWMGAG